MSNDTNDFIKILWMNTNHNGMITTSETNYNFNINITYYNGSYINETELSPLNVSTEAATNDPIALITVIPITVIYVIIFISGVIGNVITCVVISRNRSMHTGK